MKSGSVVKGRALQFAMQETRTGSAVDIRRCSAGDSYTVWVRALRDGGAFRHGVRFPGFVASAPVFRSLLPVLKWDAVRRRLHIRFRDSERDDRAVFSDRTTSTTLMTAANSPGRYRILIRSEYSDGSTSDWANGRSGNPSPLGAVPDRSGVNRDATPVITWEAFSGVSNYDLEVYRRTREACIFLTRTVGRTHRVASLLEAGRVSCLGARSVCRRDPHIVGNGQRLLIGSPPTLMYSSGN